MYKYYRLELSLSGVFLGELNYLRVDIGSCIVKSYESCYGNNCDDDSKHEVAEVRSCVVLNVLVLCTKRLEEPDYPSDNGNGEQELVSYVTPSGNGLVACGDNVEVALLIISLHDILLSKSSLEVVPRVRSLPLI